MKKKYFGTDGIRGKVGHYPITPDFFLRLGLAAGAVFYRYGQKKVIIGKDTRISGYMFESALEAGFSAAGMDVLLVGPLPTPAIAYLTSTFNASIGVVVSASHNIFEDNGIKFFSRDGVKLQDDIQLRIENKLEENIPVVPSKNLGKARRIEGAPGRYIEHCKATMIRSTLDNLSGIHIVVDTANGATYQVGPEVFRELGADVDVIANQPDGLNINENCGSTHPEALRKAVLEKKADLGIAFDGDGDRVIMVDETGALLDGDELLFIIAQYRREFNLLSGGVVGTIMSNLGFELACEQQGIPFFRAPVGDRYVNEALVARDWLLGGEPSGHIICRDLMQTGDGIIAALQVLCALKHANKPLSMVKGNVTRFPQETISVPIKESQAILENVTVQQGVERAKKNIGVRGRVLLRPSGTEDVLRITVEGENQEEVSREINELACLVKNSIK